MRVQLVELDLIRNRAVLPEMAGLEGWNGRPWGALSAYPQAVESYETLRYSDAGYVSDDHTPYPPYVIQGLSLTRALTFSAEALGGSYSVGALEIANPDGALSGLLQSRVNDHLPVRIRAGRKDWDASRQIWRDPPYDATAPVFAGLGRNWQPGPTGFEVPLLDATYWLDTAMPTRSYGGGGGLDGDKNVVGRSHPRLRGMCRNITPILIDAVNLVYQLSDAEADIMAVYEGGFGGGIAFGGRVDDLYAAPPAPGHYTIQHSPAGTWLRLGTKPVYAITLDATGRFPSGAAPHGLLSLLRQMLIEDLTLPANFIDPGWDAVSAAYDPPGGWYWDGGENVSGRGVCNTLLSGLGISLIPTRTGTLRPFLMRRVCDEVPELRYLSADVIARIAPMRLDASLDPPPWRWRIGYAHNFTRQIHLNDLHPQITADQRNFIAESDRAALWVSTTVKSDWRVPSDPPLLTTALAQEGDAAAIADRLGDVWGRRRHMWAIDVPRDMATGFELGDTVFLRAPIPGAEDGARGTVIGEMSNALDPTTTLTLLV